MAVTNAKPRTGDAVPRQAFVAGRDNASTHSRTSFEPHVTRRPGAPPATVDALMYELRTYGLAGLAGPNCQRRLADLSTAQVREVIGRLIDLRPTYPAVSDDLLLKIGEQLS